MTDHKYQAQLEAERIAEELGVDYFSLPAGRQMDIYEAGRRAVTERMLDSADQYLDRAKEQADAVFGRLTGRGK